MKRKRILSLLLCAALLCSVLPVFAVNTAPVIALTCTPACGDRSAFEGVVFMQNGADFDPSDYRISLYLQLTAGGAYWVKPTYDVPYAEIGGDGAFSVRYATGGSDHAAEIIHIMLIPASYTPTADFAAAKAVALDYVKVTRTDGGQVKVTPSRVPPESAAADLKTSGVSADGRRLAVNVGFYTDGGNPGSPLSEEQIVRQLDAVSEFADTVRIFGCTGELEKAYDIAADMGFGIIATAWLSGDAEKDLAELDALIRICNQNGSVCAACVGSETLLRGDLTVTQLIGKIQYVRDRLCLDSIPVTTAESIDFLLEQPTLRRACDILMPNCYPYWAGVSIDGAADSFAQSVDSLLAKAAGKEILVSETGWPTAGHSVGNANAGEAEAARYFEEIRSWSVSSRIPVIWFDAADELWKAADEGASGAHWGMMTGEMKLKDSYADTDFFRSVCGIDGFANIIRKNRYTTGRFDDVPVDAWYLDSVTAAYEYGLMQGTSATVFSPGQKISIAEVITMACRIHDVFYGLPDDHPGRLEWYDGYVDYAVAEGIIRRSRFVDYRRSATRAEVAVILAAALPDAAFTPHPGAYAHPGHLDGRRLLSHRCQTLPGGDPHRQQSRSL